MTDSLIMLYVQVMVDSIKLSDWAQVAVLTAFPKAHYALVNPKSKEKWPEIKMTD